MTTTDDPYQVHHQVFGNYYQLSTVDNELFRANSLRELRTLLKAGANVNAHNTKRETPLHWICSPMLSLACAKLLIRRGANVNAAEMHGQTPLFWVIRYASGHLTKLEKQKIELLVSMGADISIKDTAGKTVLDYAEDERIITTIKGILSARDKQTLEQTIPPAKIDTIVKRKTLKL